MGKVYKYKQTTVLQHILLVKKHKLTGKRKYHHKKKYLRFSVSRMTVTIRYNKEYLTLLCVCVWGGGSKYTHTLRKKINNNSN